MFDRLTLPWPPASLSPNSRKDRRRGTNERAAYKTACWATTKAAKVQIAADAHLSITFCAPDALRRDLDNMLASIKYGLDGVALAAGVDDYGWSLSIQRGPITKGGEVVILIGPPPTTKIEYRGEIN